MCLIKVSATLNDAIVADLELVLHLTDNFWGANKLCLQLLQFSFSKYIVLWIIGFVIYMN